MYSTPHFGMSGVVSNPHFGMFVGLSLAGVSGLLVVHAVRTSVEMRAGGNLDTIVQRGERGLRLGRLTIQCPPGGLQGPCSCRRPASSRPRGARSASQPPRGASRTVVDMHMIFFDAWSWRPTPIATSMEAGSVGVFFRCHEKFSKHEKMRKVIPCPHFGIFWNN